MDTKYKEDLFRKYVQFHESKLEASDSKQRAISDEYLRTAASALLSLPKIDPAHRFRLIRFYDVCENSLKSLRTSNLRSLHNAAALLETVGINLFLYPWKKEYKNIKVRCFALNVFSCFAAVYCRITFYRSDTDHVNRVHTAWGEGQGHT